MTEDEALIAELEAKAKKGLPAWHIADELKRAAGFRTMMVEAKDATEASKMSDAKDADLMARAAAKLEALDALSTRLLTLARAGIAAEKLRATLRKIEGGFWSAKAVDAIIAGDWRPAVQEAQTGAREALAAAEGGK